MRQYKLIIWNLHRNQTMNKSRDEKNVRTRCAKLNSNSCDIFSCRYRALGFQRKFHNLLIFCWEILWQNVCIWIHLNSFESDYSDDISIHRSQIRFYFNRMSHYIMLYVDVYIKRRRKISLCYNFFCYDQKTYELWAEHQIYTIEYMEKCP